MQPFAGRTLGHGGFLALGEGVQQLLILAVTPAVGPVQHTPVPHRMVGHLPAVEVRAAALATGVFDMRGTVHVTHDVDHIHQVQPHERIAHIPVVFQPVDGAHQFDDAIGLPLAQGVDQLHAGIHITHMLDVSKFGRIAVLVHPRCVVNDRMVEVAGDIPLRPGRQVAFGDIRNGVVACAVPCLRRQRRAEHKAQQKQFQVFHCLSN